MTGRALAWAVTLLAAAPGLAAAADDPPGSRDEPVAVPYRPTVSSPATLPVPGWLEVEGGFLHEHDDGARRDSVPYLLKLAFTPDWGVLFGGDAWARRTDGSGRASGLGDTAVVLKRRFAIDDAEAFGLEAGATFPTSRHGIGSGSGKTDFGLNAIYSRDVGAWHGDVNLMATRLGRADPGTGRTSTSYALAVSHPLGERFGITAEISGTQQSHAESSRQLLAAFTCNVSKRLVLDAGGARSLRSGAPVWSALAGFTWTAARLF